MHLRCVCLQSILAKPLKRRYFQTLSTIHQLGKLIHSSTDGGSSKLGEDPPMTLQLLILDSTFLAISLQLREN